MYNVKVRMEGRHFILPLNLHALLRESFRFYETDRQTDTRARYTICSACLHVRVAALFDCLPSILLPLLTACLSILPLLLTGCLSVLVLLLTTHRAEHPSVDLNGDIWNVALCRCISGTDPACRFKTA